jgi:CheY-like chemotaxis protein
VQRLTELMGGTVTAASVTGQGSAFHLRLPRIEISARLPAHEEWEPGGETDFNRLRPATLLVVDDNETNSQLVAGMFADSHHRLIFGTSGEEAVRKAREIGPDVILLDVRMPGMDGREALVEIRKSPGLELTPVIAVTASSLMNEERELREKFNGYVRKPFSKRELFDEIAHFLPRQPKPEAPATPGPGTPNSPASAAAVTAPVLLAQLRRLMAEEWPGLRDTLAINESKAFASKLQRLAQEWSCPSLAAYAEELSRQAESYAVTNLDKQLQEFPALLERLEHGSAV